MNKVKINGKEYQLKNIDFGAMCELEELGFDIKNVEKKSFSTIRALVAFTMGVSIEKAGQEIEEHLANGGKFDDFAPISQSFSESDFFTKLLSQKK